MNMLIENIKELLKGIDQTECESDEGWWETSTGAEFGRDKLNMLIELVEKNNQCYCYNCSDNNTRMTKMILCPECGNKRCPKASDHNNACTNSNEPGQEGSRYE